MAINHAFSNAVADGTNTSIVRPSDWNSAHNFTQNLAGNTAGVASVSGTDIVWAGGNNVTLSANGQTISVIAGTAAPSPVNVSAGTTSGDLGSVVFADSNGVSFGLNGSTITATVATNYQSQGAYLTTAALSNHSHGNPTLNLTNLSGTTASNSAGFTLSLSAVAALTTAALSNHSHGNPTLALTNLTGTTASNSAGLTLSLSAGDLTAFLTTAALSNHSHGNPTLALTNLSGTTASNSAGLTLSLSAAAPGGGAGNTISYFANVVGNGTNTNVTRPTQSTSVIAPFILPMALSASYIRLIASMRTQSTSIGTTANATLSFSRFSTVNAVVYVQGTGTNSTQLESIASGSAGSTQVVSLSANANGSEYTISCSITYPDRGGTAEFTNTHAVTQTRFDFSTSHLTDFTGARYLDIPFNASLAGSNYWMAIGNSSTASTTVFNLGNFSIGVSGFVNAADLNVNVARQGAATASSMQLQPALGSFTHAGGGTASVIPYSNVSSQNSHNFIYFQMIREA